MRFALLVASLSLLVSAFAEAPYQFRERLVTVHRVDRRDVTLKPAAVDADSRFGWLCSSGYTGGRPQIEWKLRKMRETYLGVGLGR